MNEKTAVKKNAFNNSKLVLTAPCPTASGKFSQLRFDFYANNPRIIVRTNDPSEMDQAHDFSQIRAAMDIPGFYVFLEMLKLAYESTSECKNKIECHNYDYVDGRKSDTPIHISDVWVGKDKENCVFVSVVSKKDERPIVKFIFGPSDNRWLKYYHADGSQYTKSETSNFYAKSYYNLLTVMMGNVIVKEYLEPPPYVPNKPAGSNYRSNNSYKTQPTEDEIPF